MVPPLSVVQVQRTSILSQACLRLFENLSILAGALHFLLHQHSTGGLPECKSYEMPQM